MSASSTPHPSDSGALSRRAVLGAAGGAALLGAGGFLTPAIAATSTEERRHKRGRADGRAHRTRVVVSTDFPPLDGIPGGAPYGSPDKKSDLDDIQTMVRFLAYANEFEIEGLVASAGTFANYADKQNILDAIDRYAQVYPNLRLHDGAFPAPGALRSVTRQGLDGSWGQPAAAILGAGKDTEASEHIIAVVDAPNPAPIWFLFWGGPRELAQALWKVSSTRSAADIRKFVSKIRVYLDDLQDGTGQWMIDTFPDLFIITSREYTGMANRSIFDGTWLRTYVTEGHGALGAAYPPAHWVPGQEGVYEGDTPSFLYLLNGALGLSDPELPALGGWGGSFRNTAPNRWEDSVEGAASISRWEAARNWDFAARMDWCVKPYHLANHNPVVHLNGDTSRRVLRRSAAVGSTMRLSAEGSWDPDGDELSYAWFEYPVTAGVAINDSTGPKASFVVPHARGTQISIVLEVTDSGSPNLTSYRRMLVNVV